MSTLKKNSDLLLEAANRFLKMAQTFEYSKDPMNTALMGVLGKPLSAMAGQYMNDRGISSLQINLNYAPPSATFVVYASGAEADAVQKEMADSLNSKFGAAATKIMARFQKDKPIDYKLATFER